MKLIRICLCVIAAVMVLNLLGSLGQAGMASQAPQTVYVQPAPVATPVRVVQQPSQAVEYVPPSAQVYVEERSSIGPAIGGVAVGMAVGALIAREQRGFRRGGFRLPTGGGRFVGQAVPVYGGGMLIPRRRR